ncbi:MULTISPECIES: MFS transporter [Pseudomonas]|uniref:MFS transporter n=1 Tax=Pseudomonas TaxID=286 RepID=UPI002108A868|nr:MULTISPECIES: MFS transporter [Pseudomonas]
MVAVLFFLTYTIASADRANLGVALPYIRKDFEMSNTEAGALISLFLLAYAFAQLPSGFLISKFGVRKLFSFSMIATSICTGLMGTINSIITLKFLRVALGISEGPLAVGLASTINNWFPTHEKGTATGIFLAAAKFGPVIVPPACVAIIAIWGWREIFFIFAIPGILLAVLWYFFVPNNPKHSRFVNHIELNHIRQESNSTPADSGRSYYFPKLDRLIRRRQIEKIDQKSKLFTSPDLLGCAIGFGCQVGIINVILAWIPTYLVTVKNYSLMNVGFVAAAPWVGAVIGNLLGGYVSDKVLGNRRKPGMMLSAAAVSFMMFALNRKTGARITPP